MIQRLRLWMKFKKALSEFIAIEDTIFFRTVKYSPGVFDS